MTKLKAGILRIETICHHKFFCHPLNLLHWRIPLIPQRFLPRRRFPRLALHLQLRQQLRPPVAPPLRLRLGPIALAKLPIRLRTKLQGRRQPQKCRMPLRQPILGQPVIAAVIAEIIEKPLLNSRCLRIAMNIPNRIQRPPMVTIRKPRTVIPLLPSGIAFGTLSDSASG
jgi:hypothetical protein